MNNGSQLNQQSLWVKEQEVNALKVQNRHLIVRLEEAEKNSKPNQINTQAVASEVRAQLKPIIEEIQKQNVASQNQLEKSLKQAFEMMQSTLRGVYQQTQRAQNAIETSTFQTRDVENRMAEARKADLVFFQEKIFSLISAFLDRMERQIDNRLSAMSSLDIIIAKQNEALADLEMLRGALGQVVRNTDGSKAEVNRVEKAIAETTQKILELEAQSRNAEEALRDTYQQVQNHRSEFKLARGEIRTMIEQSQKIGEKITILDERIIENTKDIRVQTSEQEKIRQEIRELEAAEGVQELIEMKNDDIQSIETALQNAGDASKEDLAMVLQLLKTQKEDLTQVAKRAENYLRNYSAENSTGNVESDHSRPAEIDPA